MIHRVVELQERGNHAHLEKGFLVVERSGNETGRVPLDDITAVLFSAPGNSISTNLIVGLAERSVCTVVCGDNYHPKAMVLPYDTHHLHRQRLEAQIAASEPLKKRLWQQLVKAKIEHQSACLRVCARPDPTLDVLVHRVGSGDPENIEAQVARRYWLALFGESFVRDPSRPGLNALLNYGYTVLRAATARGLVTAGLYPALGVFHRNQANPFVLADDLMEPFRPVVDATVYSMWQAGLSNVTTDAKRRLACLLTADVSTGNGYTIIANALHSAAQSLARSLMDGMANLDLPVSMFPKH